MFCARFCGRDEVLFRWRCDTLCTSRFVDDVTFFHKTVMAALLRDVASAAVTG